MFLDDTPGKFDSSQAGMTTDRIENQAEKKTRTNLKNRGTTSLAQINDMSGNKEIERILIFYKDKTFSEYTPS
jgi:hypothetical protein